jgi:hypothetical protein
MDLSYGISNPILISETINCWKPYCHSRTPCLYRHPTSIGRMVVFEACHLLRVSQYPYHGWNSPITLVGAGLKSTLKHIIRGPDRCCPL